MKRAIVVPAALGLLPSQGLQDPFAEVRASALNALRDVGPTVEVIGDLEVGTSLLSQSGFDGSIEEGADVLVVCADGSATRTEKAPGHFDPRSADFDAVIGKALAEGDGASLAMLDAELGAQLWSRGVPAFQELGRRMPHPGRASLDYSDAPFGVAYWVATWQA